MTTRTAPATTNGVAQAEPANIIEAIARIMTELPGIGKGSKADPKQGGYAYRGIEAITAEAQVLCGRYRVVFTPKVLSHSVKDIVVNAKPWTDTTLEVLYTVYGPGGLTDRVEVGPLIAIGRDNSDKGSNKAMTQAFKYALIQTFCISDKRDDADGQAHEADQVPVVTPEQQERGEMMHVLSQMLGEMPEDERGRCTAYLREKFGPSGEMTLTQAREATAVVVGWPDTAPFEETAADEMNHAEAKAETAALAYDGEA